MINSCPSFYCMTWPKVLQKLKEFLWGFSPAFHQKLSNMLTFGILFQKSVSFCRTRLEDHTMTSVTQGGGGGGKKCTQEIRTKFDRKITNRHFPDISDIVAIDNHSFLEQLEPWFPQRLCPSLPFWLKKVRFCLISKALNSKSRKFGQCEVSKKQWEGQRRSGY